ncbi:hypothetical protein N2152v2_001036 [Parachlorella kessleri]
MNTLQQQLDRLRVPQTVVRQYAVVAIFEALASPALPQPARDVAVRQCLQLKDQHPVVAAGAASGIGGHDWGSHVLSRALQANPAAAQPLLQGVLRELARKAGTAAGAPQSPPSRFLALLAALHPFIAFVLLSPDVSQQHPALAPDLHGGLARFACCGTAQQDQQAVLALLVGLLPARLVASPVQQGALVAAVGDILDVMESCSDEPEPTLVANLIAHLLALCFELVRLGGPSLPLLSALRHLSGYWPELLRPQLGLVAHLVPRLGGQECLAVLSLLGKQLNYTAKEGEAALLLPPLLQLVAFSQDPTTKQWASHCLAILASIRLTLGPAQLSGWGLQRLAGTPSGATAAEPAELSQQGGVSGQADVAMSQQTLRLLVEMWADEGEALRWLYSLEASLTAVASSSSGPQPGSKELAELDSYTASVLTGLLHHPSAAVQVAAVHCIEVAVKAIPLLGLSFLPVLVHRIQQLVESFLAGWEQSTPTSLLPMLRALPSLAQHAAVVPFVVRAIQPLLSSGSPEVLQALALRLLCLLWLRGGRGYQHLRIAILGFAAPGAAVGLELRVSRAESLQDICQEDPNRGLELVRVECLEDAAPQVQALGLRCIELLCEADCLDFYKAWRVVQARFPSLPSHPAAAAAWVALLAQGVLDADVYPEVARGTLSALWLAAANPSPQVRRQAYASLKEYSFDLQEQIEALPPLINFVDLLVAEQHPGNKAACEALVIKALAHEHATRRRPGGLLGAEVGSRQSRAQRARPAGQLAAAGKEATVASHRLLVTVPRLLLGGSASNTSEVLRRLLELSPVAVLAFYAPSAPPASSSAAGMAAAAREAAASYQLVFTELLKQAMPSHPATLACSAAMLLLPAWRRFLKRWAAALRAGARQQQQQPASGAEVQAHGPDLGVPAMAVWAAIRPQLSSSSPVVAENAVWAAAALCWVGQQPLKDAVHAVHAELSRLAGEAQAPAAVQRAALTALGALAGHVKSLLGHQEVKALVSILLAALQQGPVSGTAARTAAAAAEGLGLACMELHLQATAGGGSLAGPAGQAVLVMLGSLLGVLCTLSKADGCDVASVEAAAAGSGLRLQQTAVDQRAVQDGELLEAVSTGLLHAMTAATEVLQPSVFQALHGVLLDRLQSTAQQGPQQQQEPTAAPAPFCTLVAALTAAGFRQGWATNDAVGNTLAALLGMLGSLGITHGVQAAAHPGGVDGRVVGAASAALGTLLPALLAQGYSPAAEQSPQAVLQSLTSHHGAPALARLPHTAAAKTGLAAGIAGLLGPAAGIDPGSGLFKAALAALEGLALSDQDPRARRSAAAVLAEYCCQFRKRQGSRGDEAGSADSRTASGAGALGGSIAARSLATLSDEGALRPLVESLLEGRLAAALDASEEGSSDHPGLTAGEAASILRCLAAAERLPALNFSTLCRRALRSHPGDVAVELGCISLAAAHGQVQSNQLADLNSELLTGSRFQQLNPHAQHAVLRSLPRLLRPLPDSQAAAALQALGALCPGTCSSDSNSASALADGAHLPWVAALLEGLLGVLAGRSGSTQQQQQQQQQAQQAAAVPPPAIAVLRQVQQLLSETLLFCLPPPSTLPIGLTQQAVGIEAEQGQTPAAAQGLDCWERVVQCFAAAFPADKLEDLLCFSFYSSLPLHTTFLAAVLVARGAVNPRALQRARNLLINGELKSQPGQEDEVAVLLGRAAASLPSGAAQQQWLQDGLDASASSSSCSCPCRLRPTVLAGF